MHIPAAKTYHLILLVGGLGLGATADATIALIGSYGLGEPNSIGTTSDPMSNGFAPLKDSAGTANDFTHYQNGGQPIPSIQTTGLAAPGSTAAIQLIQAAWIANAGWTGTTATYGLTDDWAAQLWVKVPEVPDVNQSYLLFSTNEEAADAVTLEVNKGRINLIQGASAATRMIGFAYSPDEWFRATLISYDGTVALYQDDQRYAVATTTSFAHALNSLMLSIGPTGPGLRGGSGTYDELRVWSFDHTTDSLGEVVDITVPEPASTALMGIGVLGLLLRRRRPA